MTDLLNVSTCSIFYERLLCLRKWTVLYLVGLDNNHLIWMVISWAYLVFIAFTVHHFKTNAQKPHSLILVKNIKFLPLCTSYFIYAWVFKEINRHHNIFQLEFMSMFLLLNDCSFNFFIELVFLYLELNQNTLCYNTLYYY